jgi:ubiquinone/menaquinone biosynthesis C-methylase UbiE
MAPSLISWAGGRGLAGDACRLPVRDESFDLVISSEMLEHTDTTAIMELARSLAG